MKIKKVHINNEHLICKYLPANYAEAFECIFSSDREISADDIMVAFWTSSPKWIARHYELHDCIEELYEIRQGIGRNYVLFENAIRSGGSYRFISVVAKSDDETVISVDDKHLKMYFSVKINDNQQKLTVSTVIHFHNLLEHVYFYTVYPFHWLVILTMIKSAVKNVIGK